MAMTKKWEKGEVTSAYASGLDTELKDKGRMASKNRGKYSISIVNFFVSELEKEYELGKKDGYEEGLKEGQKLKKLRRKRRKTK